MLSTQKQSRRLYPSEKKMLKEAMSRYSTALLFSRSDEETEILLNAMENLHQIYSDEFEVH